MPIYKYIIDTGSTKLTPATLIAAIHGFFGITAIVKDLENIKESYGIPATGNKETTTQGQGTSSSTDK